MIRLDDLKTVKAIWNTNHFDHGFRDRVS